MGHAQCLRQDKDQDLTPEKVGVMIANYDTIGMVRHLMKLRTGPEKACVIATKSRIVYSPSTPHGFRVFGSSSNLIIILLHQDNPGTM